MRVLIAGSRSASRSALRGLLQIRLGAEVVAEAADTVELLARAEATQPNVVLLDWDVHSSSLAHPSPETSSPEGLSPEGLSPGGRALQGLIAALHRLACQPKVVILGMSSESGRLAMAAGADAFVSKRDPPRWLLTAIHAVQMEGSNV